MQNIAAHSVHCETSGCFSSRGMAGGFLNLFPFLASFWRVLWSVRSYARIQNCRIVRDHPVSEFKNWSLTSIRATRFQCAGKKIRAQLRHGRKRTKQRCSRAIPFLHRRFRQGKSR
jgi:hypothetical protein